VRVLGRGSTADVYLAREPGLQRLVAVKVMRREVAADDVGRRRFLREAQSAARVAHPNTTAIYRFGQLDGDLPYIVMEYIEGRLVRDVIDATGPLPLPQARGVLAAVASALASIHDSGIVHRDVQPGNVYIENRTGRAVLGDFGIAGVLDSGTSTTTELTVTGVQLGDLRYTSSERLQGEKATDASDIYSFGVMAYEVLTGRGPYAGESETEQLIAHLHSTPMSMAELRPDLDAGTAQLIERCLAKDPNRRPRAHDLAARLAAPDTGSFPAALPHGSQGPMAEFLTELKRRRVYQVAVGYGAFAVAVLGATEALHGAWDFDQRIYQIIATTVLAGFPIALALAWIYDITATGIQRTDSSPRARYGVLKWVALGASILAAAGAGWLLFRS
jgi:serine/threonine protein kinase